MKMRQFSTNSKKQKERKESVEDFLGITKVFCSVEAEVSISVAVPKLMESLTRILWVSLILHFAVNAFLFFKQNLSLENWLGL